MLTGGSTTVFALVAIVLSFGILVLLRLKKQFKVIVVDGCIGAGKSTLLDVLADELSARGYRVVPVKEPVEKWKKSGLLVRFYSNVSRYAYHFQTMAFHDRVAANIAAHQANVRPNFKEAIIDALFESLGFPTKPLLFILERSNFTDPLFMEMLHEGGLIDDLEMSNYKDWSDMWGKVMPYTPDLFVYLKPDIDVCMARCNARKREGESAVTLEYQIKLEAKHDTFFSQSHVKLSDCTAVKCVVLQTNEDFRTDRIKSLVADRFLTWIK